MNKHTLSVAITFLFCTPISGGIPDGIYHKGWIDFNKNGKMDLYENPKARWKTEYTERLPGKRVGYAGF